MILIIEESPETVTFENVRNGLTFHAWLKEGSEEWIVTKQGAAETWGQPDIWGRAKFNAGSWLGYPGNLPDTEPKSLSSREDAFEWITNDRPELH